MHLCPLCKTECLDSSHVHMARSVQPRTGVFCSYLYIINVNIKQIVLAYNFSIQPLKKIMKMARKTLFFWASEFNVCSVLHINICVYADFTWIAHQLFYSFIVCRFYKTWKRIQSVLFFLSLEISIWGKTKLFLQTSLILCKDNFCHKTVLT